MAWVHIRDDHLTYGNFLASCQAHSSGTFCIAQNFLDQRVRADFSAMRLQMFGESERNAVHPPLTSLLPAFCKTEAKSQPSSAPPASSGEAPRKVANEPNKVFVASASSVWFAHDRTLCMLNR